MNTTIYVDADACPVKEETFRVAKRYDLPVVLVAAQWLRIPPDPRVRLELVSSAFDAADDWIVERVTRGDIVVTADIPLAARCLEKEARVLGHRGDAFDEQSIGNALAMRDLFTTLRATGEVTGGAAPFAKTDRSSFLQGLDRMVQAARRQAGPVVKGDA